ncbi:hypothetical protein MYCTH_2310277 [Thermothelomyces thermophilus ATCC 42464]|uniref:BTB domain-containing protein n=1 Tax=Thermothelomyces thermophilus (strain ATCC 42464 / BCRC 31852 / DSM 1799) TaxID=573729 RepID=G2QLA8_THET4|nr:uncharacterized protein MYCTH_2310277 [Thermothelomyces thermophilus ATCC 42464]AEO60740.1 hypothetical protein MYCTH_2310277 [Thermothelomyces thermophilus ATCC 42464]
MESLPPSMPPPTTAGSVHRDGPQMMEMDVDGDLVLRVGSELGKAQDFRVCSATMRRASPIWKIMLFGPWKEAKPTEGNWRVDLPDDNPWPMGILLAIIHSKFGLVQRVESLGEVHEILLVADKYDMTALLQPWAACWIHLRLPTPPGTGSRVTGRELMLRIHAAWELGDEGMLSSVITHLVFSVSISNDSDSETQVSYKGETIRPEQNYGPPDLLELIQKRRLAVIQKLLDFYHEQVNRRTTDTPDRTFSGSWDPAGTQRDCQVLGSTSRSQRQRLEELGPLPAQATAVTQSANAIMQALSDVFARGRSLHRDRKSRDPSLAYQDLLATIEELKMERDVLEPHHKERLAAQRMKMGLGTGAS